MENYRVLIIYYSFTHQVKSQLKKFREGLESEGVEVGYEQLMPLEAYQFPFRSNLQLMKAMVKTFFRNRMAIQPLSEKCYERWDLIVLAGPTWSYNPSGPMLSFLDQYAEKVCRGKKVMPFISCRAYWRYHCHQLEKRLNQIGAVVEPPIVFEHPAKEPWRFIGLVLQLRGMIGKKIHSLIKSHYPSYGHNQEQRMEALECGKKVATRLIGEAESSEDCYGHCPET